MKYGLLLLALLAVPFWGWLTQVRDRNEAVQAGQRAYSRQQYELAAQRLAAAVATRAPRQPAPNLLLAQAHAELRAGRPAAARATYERLLTSPSAAVSSVARQQLAVLSAEGQDVAQALGLLKQALVQDPTNAVARYDFEVLSDYLEHADAEPPPPPPTGTGGHSKDQQTKQQDGAKDQAEKNRPAEQPGTDRPGETNSPRQRDNAAPPSPPNQPNPAGQPNTRQPTRQPNGTARGSRGPGAGTPSPVASGTEAGQQRGLDLSGRAGRPAPAGTSARPGSEAAAPADLRLQTQRERLKAMNLSPAQARQVLDALQAQEQQYFQQQARPPAEKPDPTKPTW